MENVDMLRYLELKSQFDEGLSTRGYGKTKGAIKTKIVDQLDDHAIVDFDALSASFCFMYAQYLDDLKIDHSVVAEIVLVGKSSRRTVLELHKVYPKAQIFFVEKDYTELTYNNLFRKHTLVLVCVHDIFKDKKATRTTVCDDYETTPNRPVISKFAKLLSETRFLYNIIVYNCDEPDMEWQMSDIINKTLKVDTVVKGKHDYINVIANIYIDSLKWYENKTPFLVPKIAFEERAFVGKGYLFYNCPLEKSKYIEHLSHQFCGNPNSIEIMTFISHLTIDEQKEYQQTSPYEIASNFHIYKLMEVYGANPLIAEQILQCYENAANDGITEAYNNIGVYYTQIGDYETAKQYFIKAHDAGSINAPVNLFVLAQSIELDETEKSKWENILSKENSQVMLWNNALKYWKEGNYSIALSLFEQLSEQEDNFQSYGKGLCQMALKNLIKLYHEGKPEAGIEKDINKVIELLPKLNKDENEEVIAVLLAEGILTRINSFESDERCAFKLFSKLYKSSKFVSNHTYNMAVCYSTGLGCKYTDDAGKRKALSLCQDLLNEQDRDNLHFLVGNIYRMLGEDKKCIEELEKFQDGGFSNQSNIMMALSSLEDKQKWYNKCNELMQKPGCFHCHEAFKYDENDRVCPKVLQELGDYFKSIDDHSNALSFYECASNYDYPNAYQSLGKIAVENKEWQKAETLFKKAVSLGRKNVLASLVWIMLYQDKTINKELLHYAMLSESINENAGIEYFIYLNLRSISRIKDEEYTWLEKSANKKYDPALIEFSKFLEDKGELNAAISFLMECKERDSETNKRLNKLIAQRDKLAIQDALIRERKISDNEYDEDDNDCQYYDDYRDDYSWEDSIMDALDGEPDAYWNID